MTAKKAYFKDLTPYTSPDGRGLSLDRVQAEYKLTQRPTHAFVEQGKSRVWYTFSLTPRDPNTLYMTGDKL